jgi:hypothetical protein
LITHHGTRVLLPLHIDGVGLLVTAELEDEAFISLMLSVTNVSEATEFGSVSGVGFVFKSIQVELIRVEGLGIVASAFPGTEEGISSPERSLFSLRSLFSRGLRQRFHRVSSP